MTTKKKSSEGLRPIKSLKCAIDEVTGIRELIQRFERNVSVQGRSQSTLHDYSHHLAVLALYYGCLPIHLPDQVLDYLFELQQRR